MYKEIECSFHTSKHSYRDCRKDKPTCYNTHTHTQKKKKERKQKERKRNEAKEKHTHTKQRDKKRQFNLTPYLYLTPNYMDQKNVKIEVVEVSTPPPPRSST